MVTDPQNRTFRVHSALCCFPDLSSRNLNTAYTEWNLLAVTLTNILGQVQTSSPLQQLD